ncbi:MAG: hypothetical protein KDA34_12670, partial [Phycisphaerales bacterium]|nr:hypothetical protein [Phycisphaerales bacterium]
NRAGCVQHLKSACAHPGKFFALSSVEKTVRIGEFYRRPGWASFVCVRSRASVAPGRSGFGRFRRRFGCTWGLIHQSQRAA